MNRQWTPTAEQIALWVDAYEGGASLNELAVDAHIHPGKVRKYLVDAGVTIRSPHGKRSRRHDANAVPGEGAKSWPPTIYKGARGTHRRR